MTPTLIYGMAGELGFDAMSSDGGSTLTGFVTGLLGVVVLILGVILVYISLYTEYGAVDPRILTPFGIATALIGAFMLITKKT